MAETLPLGATPFPRNEEATAYALNFRIRNFIGRHVFPHTSKLLTDRFSWIEHDIEDPFTVPDTALGRTGEPNRVEYGGKRILGETVHKGLQDCVPVTDVDSAGLMIAGSRPNWPKPVQTATQNMLHQIELSDEKQAADLLFAADSYGAAYREVVAAADKFTADGSDPFELIALAKDKMLFAPNVMVIGHAAWTRLSLNSQVRKAHNVNSGADTGIATLEELARRLQLETVLIGSQWINTAKEGQPLSKSRLWGNHISMFYNETAEGAMPTGVPGAPGTMDPTAGSYEMGNMFCFDATYEEVAVFDFFNPKGGLKGTYDVHVKGSNKKIIAGGKVGMGYLLQNVI